MKSNGLFLKDIPEKEKTEEIKEEQKEEPVEIIEDSDDEVREDNLIREKKKEKV